MERTLLMVKRSAFLVVVLSAVLQLAAAPAPARQTLRGYLVDMACVNERHEEGAHLGPKHTKACLLMPDCVKSGYAVLTADEKVYAFDARGNQLATKLIAATNKDKDWRIVVSGRVSGSSLKVAWLRLEK